MSRKALFIIVGISVFAAALVVGAPAMHWSGGFGQVEYQIRFVGADGTPIPGVQLRVENEQGINFFHYPVLDYSDGRVPASSDDGVLTFHHVSNGSEFGSRCWELFGIRFGTCRGPIFVCRFVLDGNEVYRSKFNDMNASAADQRVTRTWNRTEWLPARGEGESIMDMFSRESDNRDKDRNGKVDMGESAALNSIASLAETAWSIERGSIPATEDLEFWTYRKTVVVK